MNIMTLITKINRATGGLKRSSNSKMIALGIWAIACILLFDRLSPKVGFFMEIGQEVGNVANNILVVEKVAPFVPHRPFDPNHPKMVLILAYQRVGSSFTGQIFNQNPDIFYLFEPVDGIYTSMYGTGPGFAVPSDISYFWNGTMRDMPREEIMAVAEIIGSLLTCDFDTVPTEVLIHRFFGLFKRHHKRLSPYINCFKQKHLEIPKCRESIEHICPRRFGSDPEKELYCRDALWYGKTSHLKSLDEQKAFDSYRMCMNKMRVVLSTCMPEMEPVCTKSNIRAAKTVRLNMHTAEYMFSHFTNFRIVHLIRDPRAVALSRILGDPTYRGKSSGRDIPKEAHIYCNEVLRDIKIRQRIEQRFPGSVMQVIYEHFVSNPYEQAKGIYSFLNDTMPDEVENWLMENTESAKHNSTKIAEKWQDRLTFKIAKAVSDACGELYNAINYRWPQ